MKKKDLKKQIVVLRKEASLKLGPEKEAALAKTIHLSSLAAGSVGAGLAQVPGSDSALIVPIQINMIRKLAGEFGLSLNESSLEIILGTGLSTLAGRTASQFLVGWLPLAGNVINAATAGLVTELLGWTLSLQFSQEAEKKDQTK